ncbi:MAG: flippase-like domain-containing protein [Anaerolineae bacterium]|nr:flippase-like domain-containing protein [Anaerolineae bacterium]
MRRRRTTIGYLVGAAAILAMAIYVYRHWETLVEANLTFNFRWLALSLVLMVPVGIVPSFLWGRIMRDGLGVRLSWQAGCEVWFFSQLTRYLPGGVWSYLSRVYLCGELGVAAATTTFSLLVEMLLILITQVTVFLVTLPFWSERPTALYWTLFVIPLGLGVLHPGVVRRVLGWIARRGGAAPTVHTELGALRVPVMLAGYTTAALGGGVAFYCLVRAIYPAPPSLLPALAGMVNISATVGFLFLVAPSGLGVREGTLAFLLSLYLPAPVAVAISLASRVWLIVAEALSIGLCLTATRIVWPDRASRLRFARKKPNNP